MAGKLTKDEVSRMIGIMNQYPGPMGMMMGGFGMMSGCSPQNYYNQNWRMSHMGYGWGNGNSIFGVWVSGLTHIVWLLISILALVWFWQRIVERK